jgi:hypothetical protein
MTVRKKPFKRIVAAALLLVIGAYLYLNLGSIITRTTEKIASDALGVKVNIGRVDVSLSDKRVTVHSLKISNPPGYHKSYAMTAETILIGLNTASKQLIDFKDIQVKGSVVNLEVNEKGMNLTDLKNLANGKEQKESMGSEQIRVIIEHMVIDASVINTSIPMLNRDIQPLRLPAMNFSNIGSGGGVTAGIAIEQVFTQYLSAAENAARQGGLLKDLPNMGDAKGAMGNAAKKLQGLFR